MMTAKELVETSPSKGEAIYYRTREYAQSLLDLIPSLEQRLKDTAAKGYDYYAFVPPYNISHKMLMDYLIRHGYIVNIDTDVPYGLIIYWGPT